MVSLCTKCLKPKQLNVATGASICYCDYIGEPAKLSVTTGGTKHDEGKPPLSIVPRAALELTASVFAFGSRKYSRDNYKKGFNYTRLVDAAMRHLVAAVDGEDLDKESGLSHLGHALCCISMLVECQRLSTITDDRYKKESK